MDTLKTRTWAEINTDRLSYNIQSLKSCLRPHTKLLCAVKANGYGHGAVEVSKTFIKAGADYLAVATIDEGIELRENGIDAPILCLGYLDKSSIDEAITHDITLTVFALNVAEYISSVAQKQKKVAKIHIKIDTGMGRIGYVYTEKGNKIVISEIAKIMDLPAIEVEGIFTHMSCSDEEQNPYNYLQINNFRKCVDDLEKANVSIPIKHICNSSAIMNFPQVHMKMNKMLVRILIKTR